VSTPKSKRAFQKKVPPAHALNFVIPMSLKVDGSDNSCGEHLLIFLMKLLKGQEKPPLVVMTQAA
jgi:hypothetical protein